MNQPRDGIITANGLTSEFRFVRQQRIPEPIVEVSRNNHLVHRLCMEFCCGRIITLDEMLCQMVVLLAHNWNEQQRRACEAAMLAMPPIIVSREAALSAGIPLTPKAGSD